MDTLDIVSLIEKNPLTRLNRVYNSKFIEKIKANFTDTQQQLFVASFYCYLNYDSKNDFVVDLDDIWKWIGFSRKDHCKRLLEKHFICDIDFKIVSPLKEESTKIGRPNEQILLNIETFKELCISAATEKSKEIKKYYIKLERLLQELLDEETSELRKQLLQQKETLNILEIALQVEKDTAARIANRGAIKGRPEKSVYICEGSLGHKVGETKNPYDRESDLKTGGVMNKMVYIKKCFDRKLVEKLTHHILSNYRISKTREWFDVSFDIVKCTLDCTQLFADGLLNKGKYIYETGFYEKLNDLIKSLPSDNIEILNQDIQEEDSDNDSATEEIEEDNSVELDENTNNPLDFNKFIEECCIKDENSTAFSVDIFGAHRLWSRCVQKKTHDALYKYLCDNFKNVKVFDPISKAKLSSYKGFTLKPITFVNNDPLSDIDEFINEKCIIAYSVRLPLKVMYDTFESWKIETNPDYKINTIEKKRIDTYFGNKFLRSHVYNGKSSVHGFFGVGLKDDDSFVGLKLAEKLKKKVVKVDIETKQIVETYSSLTEAAKIIGKSPSYVSQDIRFKKPQGKFIYQFA